MTLFLVSYSFLILISISGNYQFILHYHFFFQILMNVNLHHVTTLPHVMMGSMATTVPVERVTLENIVKQVKSINIFSCLTVGFSHKSNQVFLNHLSPDAIIIPVFPKIDHSSIDARIV